MSLVSNRQLVEAKDAVGQKRSLEIRNEEIFWVFGSFVVKMGAFIMDIESVDVGPGEWS